MSDIVLRPTFPAEELERQRHIYFGRIAQEEKEPFVSSFKTFQRELFGPDHPYAQPFTGSGTTASIKAIAREDLVAYYRANYFPDNAALVVVGDITLEEARQYAEEEFGAWKPGAVARREVPAPEPLDATKVRIVDKPRAAQSTISVGHLGLRRNDPAYEAFDVMNNALGGQFVSRLNLNLREDKGYAYGVSALALGLRGVGPYVCFAAVQTQKTKEAIVEIVKEIRDIVGARPITDEEVAFSKSNLIRGFPQGFTSVVGIAAKMGEIVMYDLPDDEWTGFEKRVIAIDGRAATQAAKDYLRPDALLIVVVGDREKIEPGLRELGLGEVVTLTSREGKPPEASAQ